MNKFDEALELLDNGCDGPDAFDIYKKALEYGKKLEALLELYRKYLYVTEKWYETTNSGYVRKELVFEIEKLESEIKK